MSSGVEALATATAQDEPGSGVSRRIWYVAATHGGPPYTVDLAATSGGATIVTNARISRTYRSVSPGPAVNDGVYVLVNRPGGSSRAGGRIHGGDCFVIDTVAYF